jgi:hypothetical protein
MVLDGVSPGLGGLQGAGVPVSHPNAAAIASALGQGPPDPPAVCGVPVKDGLAPGERHAMAQTQHTHEPEDSEVFQTGSMSDSMWIGFSG